MLLKLGSKGDDVKLLQTKLNSLELNVGVVDGIFGKNTDTAVRELQYIFSLAADGIVGNQTYSLLDKLDKIKNFKLAEFRCRHCGKLKLNINLLLKLEELRTTLGNKPMIINSGYRCITHNNNVGGIRTSEHLKGNAADIRVVGTSPDNVHKVADTMFNGVGKYNTFTHVDVGVNRYRWDNSTKKKDSIVKTIKRFNSNIFYIETNKDLFVDADLGVRFKKETVREIVKNEKAIAGINAGFFSASKASEHIGLYIDEGLYYNPPNSDSVEFIYYKSGKTEITNMTGYDKKVLSDLQENVNWAIGSSYSLVQNGKINLENANKFSHSTSKQPRTMFGQKFDHSFVLVVADGRSTSSKGLTAKEQAEVMLELGCYNAVNLDGGGSTTMVYNNQVVNKPSDGVERKVGSVILIRELK